MCAIFSKSLDPYWAGFGGQRKGFFCCEVPEEEMYQPATNSALIILEKEGLNEEQLEEELKDLVDDNWAWQVCKLTATDFSVIFPSKESLRMAIRGGGITLPMCKTKAIVMIPTDDPLVVEKLEEVWVHLIGVPPPLRHADRLLLSTREVGRPLAVDVASLEHPSGPIKMSFGCQSPVQLQEHITLFVNMQGFRIRIAPISKSPADEPNNDPPSPPAKNGEDDKDDDQEETDEDRWDQRRKKHNDKTKNTPTSAPAGGNAGFARKSVPQAATDGYSSPCSPSACRSENIQSHKINLPASAFSQCCTASSPRRSDLEQLQLSTSLSTLNEETDEGQSYLTPGKALHLGAEDKKEIGWHNPASGESAASTLRASERCSKSNHDRPSRKIMLEVAGAKLFATEDGQVGKDLEKSSLHHAPTIKDSTPTPHVLLAESPIPELGAAVARAPRSKATPSEAQRKSARSARVADEPVLARTIRLATDKDAPSSATPGTFDSSKYTAFQSVPVDKLLTVAQDSCVIFPSSSLGPPETIISLIQARELAQADLAAARHKAEVEAAKAQAATNVEKESRVTQEGPVVQNGEDNLEQGSKDKPAKKRKVSKKQYPVGPRPLTRQARAQGSLETGDKFFWCWLPANGHSGGMLMGVRDSGFEVGVVDMGQFYLSTSILHRMSRRIMTIVGVYGPADHGRSSAFLEEVSAKVARTNTPLLMGGDFNLIRAACDKNNDHLNWRLMDLFNEHIAAWALREIPRSGARFTWTNRQINPVSTEDNNQLMITFSETELDSIHREMKSDTAPGPDGFPVLFFKRFWPNVKVGVLHILNDFMLGRIDISRLNFAILTLIPKVPGADLVSQFRPIALINVIFKIVSKAFAYRLDPIAHKTISLNQTAFIKGRNLLEGPLALIEIVHELRSKSLGGILLKLDFEKAYDRVNWEFLAEVLRCKGFEEAYIHRVLQLVSGGQTAISINGVIGPYFRNKRGVRQGDPLSPLLFNFIGEALSGILSAAGAAGHLHGVVPHLIPGGISHLQYADDTLILIQNSEENIANLKFLLMCFEDMSGLKINYHKNEVIVMGQPMEEQLRVANKLNCKRGSFPFMYLGLPISDRKLRLEQWLFLVRKLAVELNLG
ncbi:hypothetical protein QYE76_054408 [Lolium multiflorum]|uniref:Reverse transcriptase domain-containing protein n=1 Tax=Lolium multiflorum TaxID=4521 RepID=A0AAD8WKY7_LOLMU|nr:hypothetical protein QYE76_054408 [Lolium multiflorum]